MIQSFKPAGNSSIFSAVQQKVDLHKVYPLEGARRFDGYYRARCISPDHQDDAASMMIYQDGVYCLACGYKRGTLAAAYQKLKVDRAARMQRSGEYEEPINIHYLAEDLLNGDFELDEEPEVHVFAERTIPQQAITESVTRLWNSPRYLDVVRSFGFTDEAIRFWRLGLKDVGVNISDDPVNGAYENQTRIVFPVFSEGRAVQEIYRKTSDEQRGAKVQVRSGFGAHLINREVLHKGEPVLIVEGWGDVIALWQLGINAVSSSSGAGHWNNEWFDDLGQCTNLYASGDADKAGEGLIARIRYHCPWVKLIRPPFEQGSKGDWRDFVKAGGTKQKVEALMKRGRINAVLDKLRRAQ